MKINKRQLLLFDACSRGVNKFVELFGDNGELDFYGDKRDLKTLEEYPDLKEFLDWFLLVYQPSELYNHHMNVRGDVSGLRGWISSDLCGDVSNLRGRLTARRCTILSRRIAK